MLVPASANEYSEPILPMESGIGPMMFGFRLRSKTYTAEEATVGIAGGWNCLVRMAWKELKGMYELPANLFPASESIVRSGELKMSSGRDPFSLRRVRKVSGQYEVYQSEWI
jgi:hypothetical protein